MSTEKVEWELLLQTEVSSGIQGDTIFSHHDKQHHLPTNRPSQLISPPLSDLPPSDLTIGVV